MDGPRRVRLPKLAWLAVTAVVLVLLAVGLWVCVPQYRQWLALRQIQRWGGEVVVKPGGPDWLRRRLGNQRMAVFDRVTEVQLNRGSITDAGMAHLAGLTSVSLLNLTRTDAGDAGLANLRGLTTLERLWLGETRVGDAGLQHLGSLINLRDLSLEGTDVSDLGLQHLCGLKNLKWLNLRGTRVSTSGVKALQAELPGCTIHTGI